MIELLSILIINSLWTFGIHAATRDEMIFGFVERNINNTVLTRSNKFHDVLIWLSKPTTECPICMASVHSIVTASWWLEVAQDSTIDIFFIWVLFAVSLAGLNSIVLKFIK